MNDIQKIIDNLKAIDENKPFEDALGTTSGHLMENAYRNTFEAIFKALDVRELGVEPVQYDLDDLRNRIVELLEEAQASQEPQLPKGIEWPRTEDGELVRPGCRTTALWKDRYGKDLFSSEFRPTRIEFEGTHKVSIYADGALDVVASIELRPGERVKTTEPDTQKKLDDDATMNPHYYCKKVLRWDSFKRHTAKLDDKIVAMNKDLLRRQRELDARK